MFDFIDIPKSNNGINEKELKAHGMKFDNGKEISKFTFKFKEFESKASLMELPCVIESQKSLDSVNLFKSNNISQMLYVHPNNEEFLEEGRTQPNIEQI